MHVAPTIGRMNRPLRNSSCRLSPSLSVDSTSWMATKSLLILEDGFQNAEGSLQYFLIFRYICVNKEDKCFPKLKVFLVFIFFSIKELDMEILYTKYYSFHNEQFLKGILKVCLIIWFCWHLIIDIQYMWHFYFKIIYR